MVSFFSSELAPLTIDMIKDQSRKLLDLYKTNQIMPQSQGQIIPRYQVQFEPFPQMGITEQMPVSVQFAISNRVCFADHLTAPIEDWSGCRSPSRAKRRHKRGIKTRMVIRHEPIEKVYSYQDKMIMHPDIWRRISEAIDRDIERKLRFER